MHLGKFSQGDKSVPFCSGYGKLKYWSSKRLKREMMRDVVQSLSDRAPERKVMS